MCKAPFFVLYLYILNHIEILLYTRNMKFYPFEVNTGAVNMQIDRELLENAISKQSKEPIFRLYGWSPACVSLGRNQKADFLDRNLLKDKNIHVVKRLTGGRALLHDREITYSYIAPFYTFEHGDSIVGTYKEIGQIFIEKFKKLGIELEYQDKRHTNMNINYCMQVTTSADLCYKGKKLIGSAQFRKEGYVLQHGSILFNYNKDLLENVFKESIDTSHITCMNDIDEHITFADVLSLWDEC